MKKALFASAVALGLMVSSVSATDLFFEKTVGHWDIFGHPGDAATNSNPACILQTKWQDGSYMQLIQDLADGEMLIEFTNNDWNVEGPYGEGTLDLTMNMHGRRGGIESFNVKFVLVDKNTIQIRGIDYKSFLPAFMNYNKMVLIMPGDIQNSEVPLENSTNAVGIMGQCLDAADKGAAQKSLEKFKRGPEQGA